MDIRNTIEKTAEKYAAKPAFISKEQLISFLDLKRNVFKLANALKSCAVSKGDKVGIYLPNGPEYAYSYLACFCLGAVAVPMDYMLKTDELVSCLGHAEVKLLIAKIKPDISLEDMKRSIGSLTQVICLGEVTAGALSYTEIMEKADDELTSTVIKDADPALIMYTSGTTGKPKGILLTYKHLEGSPESMKYFVDLSDRDIKLCAIPLSHIAGLIYIQNCIIFGITLIIMERFNPFEFLKNIMQYRVTCFHIVPAMYTAILTMKEIEKFNLSSLRWVVVFGAPSSPDILEKFHKFCPNAKLLNGWGMTETCPPNTVTPQESQNIASVGKPAPHCQIKIVSDDGQELPMGQIGEIIISGWTIMQEYYKDPELTAQTIRNGWLHTGDLGRFDTEGFLYIMGRKKEMIKVGGQIVFAPEVEAALQKHEAVLEAAVIGVSDKLRGEVVKAFVVLKEGFQLKSEDLRYFAKDHLAHFKVPQSIELREDLPKNRTGKVDKEELKREIAQITRRFKMQTQTMKRDIHLTGKDLMGMVQLRPQDIGKYAIVPGPKERADSLIKKMQNVLKNFSFMEYTMHTGDYRGTKVTTINGGRFSPDTAITTEILCNAKPGAMIRIGSCGSLREDINVGDIVVVDGAVRGDGVTPYYVDTDFKTESDKKLTDTLEEMANLSGLKVHRGKVWTTDALLRETKEFVGQAIDDGAIIVDMVTSVFLTLCQLYKIPATAVCAVSDNIITGQMGFIDPNYYMAESALVKISLDLVDKLEGRDIQKGFF